jgi:hypothetical protein
MLNLSPLFYSTTAASTFLEALEVPQAVIASVTDACRTVRDRFREGLPRALRNHGDVAAQPRFVTQGSSVYKTLNNPAHPTQQVDRDEGLYLPLEFVKSTGAPRRASALLFQVVEEVLAPLAAECRWQMDCTKDLCIRIVINRHAHIDLPLYAIPDHEFQRLKNRSDARLAHVLDAADQDEDESLWYDLPVDQVLIAHRRNGWQKSDPRPLKKWFDESVERYSDQLRRTVRYMKAFRDYQWRDGGPASLLLMAAATQVFDPKTRRDDLALLHVVERLPSVLRAGVAHPTDTSESLTDRLGYRGVESAVQRFTGLAVSLQQAIYSADAKMACDVLVQQLGPRFPKDPRRVETISPPRREKSLGAPRVSAAVATLVSPAKPWGNR